MQLTIVKHGTDFGGTYTITADGKLVTYMDSPEYGHTSDMPIIGDIECARFFVERINEVGLDAFREEATPHDQGDEVTEVVYI